MKLHQLRILLAVAQHGSIHEASRSLHVSQPALSKAIAELERELGVTLMSRSVRGVSLTATAWPRSSVPAWSSRSCATRWRDIEAIRGHAEARLNIGFTAVASSGPLPGPWRPSASASPMSTCVPSSCAPADHGGAARGAARPGLISTNSGRAPVPSSGSRCSPSACRWQCAGHPLRRASRLRPLLDADWLTLDPLDDPGSPLPSLLRLHRLDMPRRIVQSASNLLGLQLAARTDLISMWSDFVFHGTGGPLRWCRSRCCSCRYATNCPISASSGLPLGRPDDAGLRRIQQGSAAPRTADGAAAARRARRGLIPASARAHAAAAPMTHNGGQETC